MSDVSVPNGSEIEHGGAAGRGLVDPALREALRTGAGWAWHRLFLARHDILLALATRLLGSARSATDVVAETWSEALGCAARYDPTRPPERWLAGICGHLCVDLLRRQRRRRETAMAEEPQERTPTDESGEARRAVRAAVEGLPSSQRAVTILYWFFDLRTEEVACILRITPKAVRRRLDRALEGLRAALGPRFDRQDHGPPATDA